MISGLLQSAISPVIDAAKPDLTSIKARVKKAGDTLVSSGGEITQFRYVVAAGLASYGDASNLEKRSDQAIKAAIEAGDIKS